MYELVLSAGVRAVAEGGGLRHVISAYDLEALRAVPLAVALDEPVSCLASERLDRAGGFSPRGFAFGLGCLFLASFFLNIVCQR